MSGGILHLDRTVVAPAHDLFIQQNNGSDRHFSFRFGLSVPPQMRFPHPKFRCRRSMSSPEELSALKSSWTD